jgi:hypothetical protein
LISKPICQQAFAEVTSNPPFSKKIFYKKLAIAGTTIADEEK